MSVKHRRKNSDGGKPKYSEKNVSTTNLACTGLGSKSCCCCCGERPATNGLRHATAKHCIASSNLARGARMYVYFPTPHTRRVLVRPCDGVIHCPDVKGALPISEQVQEARKWKALTTGLTCMRHSRRRKIRNLTLLTVFVVAIYIFSAIVILFHIKLEMKCCVFLCLLPHILSALCRNCRMLYFNLRSSHSLHADVFHERH